MGAPCYLWPDKVPNPNRDLSGLRVRRLVYLRPVYKTDVWFYLCQCDCDSETIVKANSKTGSCGCLRYAARRQGPAPPAHTLKKKGFDRGQCQHKLGSYGFSCEHYAACQTERVFEKKKVSSKYTPGGGCYTMTADEIRVAG